MIHCNNRMKMGILSPYVLNELCEKYKDLEIHQHLKNASFDDHLSQRFFIMGVIVSYKIGKKRLQDFLLFIDAEFLCNHYKSKIEKQKIYLSCLERDMLTLCAQMLDSIKDSPLPVLLTSCPCRQIMDGSKERGPPEQSYDTFEMIFQTNSYTKAAILNDDTMFRNQLPTFCTHSQVLNEYYARGIHRRKWNLLEYVVDQPDKLFQRLVGAMVDGGKLTKARIFPYVSLQPHDRLVNWFIPKSSSFQSHFVLIDDLQTGSLSYLVLNSSGHESGSQVCGIQQMYHLESRKVHSIQETILLLLMTAKTSYKGNLYEYCNYIFEKSAGDTIPALPKIMECFDLGVLQRLRRISDGLVIHLRHIHSKYFLGMKGYAISSYLDIKLHSLNAHQICSVECKNYSRSVMYCNCCLSYLPIYSVGAVLNLKHLVWLNSEPTLSRRIIFQGIKDKTDQKTVEKCIVMVHTGSMSDICFPTSQTEIHVQCKDFSKHNIEQFVSFLQKSLRTEKKKKCRYEEPWNNRQLHGGLHDCIDYFDLSFLYGSSLSGLGYDSDYTSLKRKSPCLRNSFCGEHEKDDVSVSEEEDLFVTESEMYTADALRDCEEGFGMISPVEKIDECLFYVNEKVTKNCSEKHHPFNADVSTFHHDDSTCKIFYEEDPRQSTFCPTGMDYQAATVIHEIVENKFEPTISSKKCLSGEKLLQKDGENDDICRSIQEESMGSSELCTSSMLYDSDFIGKMLDLRLHTLERKLLMQEEEMQKLQDILKAHVWFNDNTGSENYDFCEEKAIKIDKQKKIDLTFSDKESLSVSTEESSISKEKEELLTVGSVTEFENRDWESIEELLDAGVKEDTVDGTIIPSLDSEQEISNTMMASLSTNREIISCESIISCEKELKFEVVLGVSKATSNSQMVVLPIEGITSSHTSSVDVTLGSFLSVDYTVGYVSADEHHLLSDTTNYKLYQTFEDLGRFEMRYVEEGIFKQKGGLQEIENIDRVLGKMTSANHGQQNERTDITSQRVYLFDISKPMRYLPSSAKRNYAHSRTLDEVLERDSCKDFSVTHRSLVSYLPTLAHDDTYIALKDKESLRELLKKFFLKHEMDKNNDRSKTCKDLNEQLRQKSTGDLVRYFFQSTCTELSIKSDSKVEKLCGDIINHYFRLAKYYHNASIYPAQAPRTGLDGYFHRVLEGEEMTYRQKMRYEWLRIQSFWSFPVNIGMSMIYLARNGFYYTGRSTECRCYFCGRTYTDWEEGDNDRIIAIHERISPDCVFLRGGDHDNVPIHQVSQAMLPFGQLPAAGEETTTEGATGFALGFGQFGQGGSSEETRTEQQSDQVSPTPHSTAPEIAGLPTSSVGQAPQTTTTAPVQTNVAPSVTESSGSQLPTSQPTTSQIGATFHVEPSPTISLPPVVSSAPSGPPASLVQSQSLPPRENLLGPQNAVGRPPGSGEETAPPSASVPTPMQDTPVTTTSAPTLSIAQQPPQTLSRDSRSADHIAGDRDTATEDIHVVDVIPGPTGASETTTRVVYRVTLRFTELEYTEGLGDNNHPEYVRISGQIAPAIESLFNNIRGDQRVNITRFIPDPPVLVVFDLESFNFSDEAALKFVLNRAIQRGAISLYRISPANFDFRLIEESTLPVETPTTGATNAPAVSRSQTSSTPTTTQTTTSGAGQVRALDTGPRRTGTSTTAPPRPQRFDPLGINFDRPRYPAYAVITVRIGTFQGWPSSLTQTPDQMAVAGFFYAGYGDYVRCFFCGGGLRNWDEGDDPWVEHAKWFPRCAFVRQNKGEKFVIDVQRRHQELESGIEFVEEEEEEVPDEELPAFRSLVEMGYQPDVITRAVQTFRHRIRPGRHATIPMTSRRLIDIIFEDEGRDKASDEASIGGTRTEDRGASGDISRKGRREDEEVAASGNEEVEQTREALEENRIPEDTKLADEAASRASLTHSLSDEAALQGLKEENVTWKEKLRCRVCLDRDVAVAFLPCGHLVCCLDCAPAQRKCLICKEIVKGTVKTFFP